MDLKYEGITSDLIQLKRNLQKELTYKIQRSFLHLKNILHLSKSLNKIKNCNLRNFNPIIQPRLKI